MNYYVNGQCGHKLLLTVEGEVETRAQIQPFFEVICPNDGVRSYCLNRSVVAEPESGQVATMGGVGTFVGVLLGPIFVLAIGGAGLLVGKALEQGEQDRAAKFNKS